jgi:hypothetical protein
MREEFNYVCEVFYFSAANIIKGLIRDVAKN